MGSDASTIVNVENVVGSDFVDDITGDSKANVIDGGVAGDTISAGDGDDVVIGGDGSDTLSGGVGDDIIYGDALSTATGAVGSQSDWPCPSLMTSQECQNLISAISQYLLINIIEVLRLVTPPKGRLQRWYPMILATESSGISATRMRISVA